MPSFAPDSFVDPRHREWSLNWIGFLALNLCLLTLLCAWSLDVIRGSEYAALAIGLGVIGIWRHSWGMLNFLRAVYFNQVTTRSKRPLARGHYNLSILLPVYGQTDDMLRAVAKGLVESVQSVPGRVLVVCAYRSEEQKQLLSEAVTHESNVVIQFVRQIGLGKREAMADALNMIRTCFPAGAGNFTLLMDGDTILTPDSIQRSIGELQAEPNTGAVCVNEIPLIEGDTVFAAWRWLRSLQRNQTMSSFALSKRVLVLTGRFAMYRSEVLLQSDVINRIRKDYLIRGNHYISLLTGDDKTTWLEVLRRGYDMRYLPDVYIYPVEQQDRKKSFIAETVALTKRYSGNMARANLHPDAWRGAKGKLHFQYGLLDQRISMWTSLLTPVVLVLSLLFDSFDAFILFLTYALLIKNLQALALYVTCRAYDPYFPYLIFYNQVVSSTVKIFTFAFLHRQKWNNQNIDSVQGDGTHALDRQAQLLVINRCALFFMFVFLVFFTVR